MSQTDFRKIHPYLISGLDEFSRYRSGSCSGNLPKRLNNSSLASAGIKEAGSEEFGLSQPILKLIINRMESTKNYLESKRRRYNT